MVATRFLVAVALLTASPDSSSPTESDLIELTYPTLQQLAVQLEILDPRETKYVLSRPDDYVSDMKLLRRRCQELAGAPCIQDVYRFPNRNLINDVQSFNRTFRQNLEARQAQQGIRNWEVSEALQETDRLYEIWDKLRDARCDYYYITVRRQALKRLHELIGNESYWSGQMPPYVPVWRFHPID